MKAIFIFCLLAIIVLGYAPNIEAENGVKADGAGVKNETKEEQDNPPPPSLQQIRSKLINAVRFASGFALAESISANKTTFARIITHLVIARESQDGQTGGKLAKFEKEIEPFEDFVEGRKTVHFEEKDLRNLVRVLEQCQEIQNMNEHLYGTIEKILEPYRENRPFFLGFLFDGRNMSSLIEAVEFLQKIPEAVKSFKRLKNENGTSKVDNLTDVLNRFSSLSTWSNLKAERLDIFESFKTIKNTLNETALTLIDQQFIEDCANVLQLFSVPARVLDDLKTLKNNWKVDTFKSIYETVKNINQPYVLRDFKPKNMKIEKPGAEIMEILKMLRPVAELAGKMKNKESSDDISKLVQAFKGTWAFGFFRKHLELQSSENRTGQIIGLEKKIVKRGLETESWLDQVKFAAIVEDAVNFYDEVQTNLTMVYDNLERLTFDVSYLVNVSEKIIGFAHFSDIPKKLGENWNITEGLLQKISANNISKDVQIVGRALQQMSRIISFFKKLNNNETTFEELQNYVRVEKVQQSIEYWSFEGLKLNFSSRENETKEWLNSALQIDNENVKWDKLENQSWKFAVPNENVWNDMKALVRFNIELKNMDQITSKFEKAVEDMKKLEVLSKTGQVVEPKSFEAGLRAMMQYSSMGNFTFTEFESKPGDVYHPVHRLPKIVENLLQCLPFYFELVADFNTTSEMRKVRIDISRKENVTDEVKRFGKQFSGWIEQADKLMFIGEKELEEKFLDMLMNMGEIRKRLDELYKWIRSVPDFWMAGRVGDQARENMTGNESENDFKRFSHLIELARNPQTASAIWDLHQNLEELAKVFGYVDKTEGCQTDSFGSYGKNCTFEEHQENPPHPSDSAFWHAFLNYFTLAVMCTVYLIITSCIILYLYRSHNRSEPKTKAETDKFK